MAKSPIINLSDTPTLPQLKFIETSISSGEGLRIIKKIGAQHRDLGIQLLDDKQGEITDVLVANHPNDVNEVTHDIFKKWLTTGGRRPITWATFVAVLKEIGLNQLAQDIEKLAGIETELVHAQSHQQSEDTQSDIDMSPMKTQSKDMDNGSIVPVISIDDVKAAINGLTKKFSALKEKIRQSIKEHEILVDRVADVLTSLSPDEDEHHKMFVESHIKYFVKAENNSELFLIMNSHWNYLDPSLLNHLVSELELDDVKPTTESYKSDVQRFRKKTPLKLFFQTQRKRKKKIPSGFTTIVAKFDLPEPVMLEDVEQFRQEYASEYGLHDFAMMLIQVRPGSFVAVWIVPDAIVEKLKGNIPTEVLSKHKVQRLTVNGTLVYFDQLHESESLDEHISSPMLYESYYICDEGWSEEEALEATNLSKPSLTIVVTPPRTLPATLDTPLAIQVSSHSEDRTPVPESRAKFKFGSKEHIPLPSLDDASPPLSSAIDESHVTDSSITSLAEDKDKATKVPQLMASSHEAEPDVTLSLPPTTSDTSDLPDVVKSKPSSATSPVSSAYVQAKVRQFKKRFKELKKSTREGLKYKDVAVERLAEHLKSLPADEGNEHKLLTENHVEVIDQSIDHSEIMGNLGFNMNYHSYQILQSIANQFNLKEVAEQIQLYERDLAEFRSKTPATLFSQTQQRRGTNLPPDYKEVVAEFERPSSNKEELTIDTFHQFQERYASHYRLSNCAMIFGGIQVSSPTITATWFVPTSIAESLKERVPKILLSQHHTLMLRIAEVCVHRTEVHTEDYPFVEEPSEEFFCPVTYEPLLQPHLTSCCGKHISEEAATRIQREGEVCPLCKASDWSTVLNRDMQHKVRDLRVFCCHKDRGCRWQGQLSSFDHHVSHCPMRYAPSISNLLKKERAPATMYQSTSSLYQQPPSTRHHMNPAQHFLEPSGSFWSATSSPAAPPPIMDPGESIYLEPRSQFHHEQGIHNRHPPEPTPDSDSAHVKHRRSMRYASSIIFNLLKEKRNLLKKERAAATMYQSTSSLHQHLPSPRRRMKPAQHWEPSGSFWSATTSPAALPPIMDPGESSYLEPRSQFHHEQRIHNIHPPEPIPDSVSAHVKHRSMLYSQKRSISSRTEEKLPTTKRENVLSIKCHEKRPTPVRMIRGSATSDGQFAYFTPSGSSSLYQYEYSTEKWETLPQCPYIDSGLAIINGELTTVGGAEHRHVTNKLMTLRLGGWREEYPPMKTGCDTPAVVTTSDGNYLFVIGEGRVGGGWSSTVELLHLKTREWYTVTNLPKLLFFHSATICGNQLNVIGRSTNCFSCSLQDLPSSDQPITSPILLSWTPLPPLPADDSTAATLCGQLVLIGGYRGGSPVNSIHQLVDGRWMKIGYMTEERSECLVVNQSPNKILIAGGFGAGRSVEECTAVVV